MEIEKIRKDLKAKKNEDTVIRYAKKISRSTQQEDSPEAVLALAQKLWVGAKEEERFLAIHLVASIDRHLDSSHWNQFREWLTEADSELLRDGVSSRIFGSLVMEDRSWVRVLCHWAQAEDPLERRAAVMAVFPRTRQMSDHEAAVSVLESLLGESHEAVQGSVIRLIEECIDINREAVVEFLGQWRSRIDPVILKTVLDRLSPEDQERIRQF